MNTAIEKIRLGIEPLRQEIIHHPVYSVLEDIEDLKIFMQYHIFAVWDFMSLLKSLQNELTCTSLPWFPKGAAETRYLINEIVVGEESDLDSFGQRKSHFELYLDAMQQCGADTQQIQSFIGILAASGDFEQAFEAAKVPQAARDFVNFTFRIIHSKKTYLQSAIFTFGREDLIPNMFLAIIDDMNNAFPENISIFKYYLQRHIEVDGDHHSHLALQMTENLCEDNASFWQEAEAATLQSLQQRKSLWDGVYAEIMSRKAALA